MDAASGLSGPAHFAVGGSALSLGRPAEGLHHLELAARLSSGAASLTVGTRPDVHAAAWAAHAHWLLGHDEDASASAESAISLARAIDHPYSLAVALAYGSITHQMRRDLHGLKTTVGELGQLCDRYGFAYYREWALILDGWCRGGEPGINLARRGLGHLKSEGAFARMPYWRSLLADLSARNDQHSAARAILDAALAAAQERNDVWWLPEVMRMRAAYDSRRSASTRLHAAARMASAHGSAALLALRARPHGAGCWLRRSGRSPGLLTGAGTALATAPNAGANATRTAPVLPSGAWRPSNAPKGGLMTTTSASIGTAPYDELAGALRGDLIRPEDPGYDEARAVYNGMIDKRPAAIARCRNAADVVTCVRFARDHDAEIAVRGGGHNAGGLAGWDGALVIDLSLLRSTTVTLKTTPSAPTPDAPGEMLTTPRWRSAWPRLRIPRLHRGGRPDPRGRIGYLTRRFGLTVDNLLAADVVLADGSFVTASENSHSDLFWALRGGGGNFGIVTSFTFRCHDIGEGGTIIGGPVFDDIADTAEVMRWYRDLVPSLPEDPSGWIALLTIPPVPVFPEALWGRKAGASSGAIPGRTTGPARYSSRSGRSARRCWSACRRCRSPRCRARSTRCTRPGCSGTGGRISSTRSPTPPSTSTSSTETGCPLATRPCTCIPSTARPAACPPTRRRSPTATVAGRRHRGVDPDPANAAAISEWAKDYWQELHPTSAGGVYINFMMNEGQDRVKASYRGNYDRLAQVKRRYDPGNVFHINQNIEPAGGPGR